MVQSASDMQPVEMGAHMPLTQLTLLEHALPQLPQWLRSSWRLTQPTPGHDVWSGMHDDIGAMQSLPFKHVHPIGQHPVPHAIWVAVHVVAPVQVAVTGFALLAPWPTPSWPDSLCPQQRTEPSIKRAQTWAAPAASSTTPPSGASAEPSRRTGRDRGLPSPTTPVPQHSTVLSLRRAHPKVRPTAISMTPARAPPFALCTGMGLGLDGPTMPSPS
jgi:hypothetical protein